MNQKTENLNQLFLNNLKAMTFEEYLLQTSIKFPKETQMILGSADASPESGPAKLNSNSYALGLNLNMDIADSREFDRAALGLKAFFEIITQTHLEEWKVAPKIINQITNWVVPQIKNQEDLDSWSYAILFNDLGKLHASNTRHEQLYGQYCADHDINMVHILQKDPAFYPGFSHLPKQYQDSLINGLSSGFNLGKAVQLECPNSAWNPFLKLSHFDQNFHLGHSLFDFMGVSGANNPRQYAPFVMNNDTLWAFINCIEKHDHHGYGVERLKQVGLDAYIDNAFPISRLVAMSRIFNCEKTDQLLSAINTMDDKNYLFHELNNPGSLDNPAIELQYIPAILTQLINNESLETFTKMLNGMVHLFKVAREDVNNTHEKCEIFVLNLINLASDIKNNPIETIENISNYQLATMTGGWKIEKINQLKKIKCNF